MVDAVVCRRREQPRIHAVVSRDITPHRCRCCQIVARVDVDGRSWLCDLR